VLASRYVEGALKMDSRHPSVLRAAARFCSGLGRVEGINYWQMLSATEPLGREDRLGYARLALISSPQSENSWSIGCLPSSQGSEHPGGFSMAGSTSR